MSKEIERFEKIYRSKGIETLADEIIERMDQLKRKIEEEKGEIFWFD
jgi:hypothetical protein